MRSLVFLCTRISRLLLTSFFIILFITAYSQDIANLKNEKPFTLSGNLGLSAMFYNVEGREANRKPFTWMLNGSPTVSVYGIVFPFSFTISEQERDFRQPFNKIGVSPSYKWAKLHLGYRNIQFSQYTMGGHSILGAGLELTPGKFRFGFITGRLSRAIPYTDNPANLGTEISTPSFTRRSTSMKIGYGTETNFVDFIFLKGKDDPNSIDGNTPGIPITPAENVVLSLVTKQKVSKIVALNLEIAQSAYTRDVRSTVPDSVFSDDVPGIFKGFMNVNATSNKSKTIDGSLELNFEKYLFNIRYKRIEPDFKSMGAYYFQSDIRNITIEPTVKLNENKLVLNASLGFQKDNLNKSIDVQTNRTIGSLHATWQPLQIYQADITYSNYDLGQKSGLIAVDTLAEISQTTNNIVLSNSLNFASEKMTNSFMVSYNYQNLNDKNSNTAQQSEFSTGMLFASWFFTWLKTGVNGGISYNNTTFNQDTTKNRYSGPSINIGKAFFNQKLNITFNWATSRNIANEKETNRINITSLRATLRVQKKHRLQFRYAINKNNTKITATNSYKENRGEISYVYTF